MDSETDEHGTHHAAVERAGHVDFNFLLCKRHNHSDSARLKRDAWVEFFFGHFWVWESPESTTTHKA